MVEYAVFLRGINVGRTKRVKVSEITKMLERHFGNVRPYGQSGNFVLISELGNERIAAFIENELEKNFAFKISCVVLTKDELSAVFDNNPFWDAPVEQLYFILTNGTASKRTGEWENNGDAAKLLGGCIYLNCKGPYHETKLSNNFFEKELGVVCTARNWNTVNKILNL